MQPVIQKIKLINGNQDSVQKMFRDPMRFLIFEL